MNTSAPIHSCPYVDWYKFKCCEVYTCKNNSQSCANGCIQLSRVKTTCGKTFSDAELLFYKNKGNDTIKTISMQKKVAVERIKNILILREYVDYVKTKYQPRDLPSGKRLAGIMSTYPFKVSYLRITPWVAATLINIKVFEDFKRTKGGDCRRSKLHSVLGLSSPSLARLTTELGYYCSSDFLIHLE